MMNVGIKCEICGDAGGVVHSIQLHLNKVHPDVSIEEYKRRFPGAPLLSEAAKERIRAAQGEAPLVSHHAATMAVVQPAPAPAHATAHIHMQHTITKKPLHEIFGLEKGPETLNGRREPIPVSTFQVAPDLAQYLRQVDPDHVWNIEDLKNELMAIEMGLPLLCFGHKGSGKTTDLLQIAARTVRPVIRVQHTGNTEESHITGQWIVKGGDLEFQLGFLAVAMMQGIMYIADEYDFARPEVLAVYQPVMEGEPLVIKDAPPHLRVIRPQPGFTFCATGNTNGTGDSSGLYQGTTIQNAANYDRFGIAVQKNYMPEALEVQAVVKQTGIAQKEAEKLVKFATEIRSQFGAGKLSDTISTRALINIANVGLRRAKMRLGIQLCYSNKLNPVDAQAIEGVAQRIYG